MLAGNVHPDGASHLAHVSENPGAGASGSHPPLVSLISTSSLVRRDASQAQRVDLKVALSSGRSEVKTQSLTQAELSSQTQEKALTQVTADATNRAQLQRVGVVSQTAAAASTQEGLALSSKEALARHLILFPHDSGDSDDLGDMYGRRRRVSSLTGMSPAEERRIYGNYGRPYPAEAVRFNSAPGTPYTFTNTGNTLGMVGGPAMPLWAAPRYMGVPGMPYPSFAGPAWGFPPMFAGGGFGPWPNGSPNTPLMAGLVPAMGYARSVSTD